MGFINSWNVKDLITSGKKYLPNYLVTKPSMFSFINFMNTMDGDNLRLFGILCNKILTYYNEEVI